MHRCVPLLLLAGVPLLDSAAAPVPTEDDRAKLARAYGVWTDPDKNCTFKLTGGELKVSLPAANHLHGNAFGSATDNAPRAVREVDGDFTAVVRVVVPIPERIPGRSRTYGPHAGGGLVAWGAEKDNFAAQLDVGQLFDNEVQEAIAGVHYRADGSTHLMVQRLGKPAGKAFLRLKRERKLITAGWSRDGKTWKDFDEYAVDWGAKVKVGVVAENSTGKPTEVTFDQYQLTQPKK